MDGASFLSLLSNVVAVLLEKQRRAVISAYMAARRMERPYVRFCADVRVDVPFSYEQLTSGLRREDAVFGLGPFYETAQTSVEGFFRDAGFPYSDFRDVLKRLCSERGHEIITVSEQELREEIEYLKNLGVRAGVGQNSFFVEPQHVVPECCTEISSVYSIYSLLRDSPAESSFVF